MAVANRSWKRGKIDWFSKALLEYSREMGEIVGRGAPVSWGGEWLDVMASV